MKKKLKKVLVLDFVPIVGCCLIAALSVVYFYFNRKVFATAMPLSLLGYKILYAFGIDTPELLSGTGLSEQILAPTLENPSLILILGFAFGSILTPLLRGEYKIGGFGSLKHLITFIVGGFLVGFGVQGIYGANIGEVFGAIAMLSLSGWLVMPFIGFGVQLMRPICRKINKK